MDTAGGPDQPPTSLYVYSEPKILAACLPLDIRQELGLPGSNTGPVGKLPAKAMTRPPTSDPPPTTAPPEVWTVVFGSGVRTTGLLLYAVSGRRDGGQQRARGAGSDGGQEGSGGLQAERRPSADPDLERVAQRDRLERRHGGDAHVFS